MGASNLLVELFTLQSVHVFVKLRVSEAKFMSGLRQPGLVQLHYICPWTSVVKQFPGYSVTATRQLFSTKIRKRYSFSFFVCANSVSSFLRDCVFARSWKAYRIFQNQILENLGDRILKSNPYRILEIESCESWRSNLANLGDRIL